MWLIWKRLHYWGLLIEPLDDERVSDCLVGSPEAQMRQIWKRLRYQRLLMKPLDERVSDYASRTGP